ncbi:MAG: response regulator transcription factor [Bacteroidia bacterium]|nr:response regulator transcription factor [Bacteroidia bacterium]
MSKKISVAIVEDDKEISGFLQQIVSSQEDLELIGAFDSVESFAVKLPDMLPDVVLLDISLPGRSGLDFLPDAKKLSGSSQFLMCTVFDDEEKIFECLKRGATGYIVKSSSPELIVSAIRDIHAGGSPMSATIARKVVGAFSGVKESSELDSLTAREREILHLLDQGLRYKEIAEKIFLSVETVRTHIRNIYIKLQVQSRTEALNKLRPKKFFLF